MVELIRKLTSNYDEKEYRDWLFGEGVDFKEENEIDWPKDHHNYFEVMAPDDTYIFINKSLYKKIDIMDILTVDGNEDFKDMDIMLDEIACRTGYSKEMISDLFDEGVDDLTSLGEDFFEARRQSYDNVATISHEMDW